MAKKNNPPQKKPEQVLKDIQKLRDNATLLQVQARPFSFYPEDEPEVHLKSRQRPAKEHE